MTARHFPETWAALRQRQQLLASLRAPSRLVRLLAPSTVAAHAQRLASSRGKTQEELEALRLVLGVPSIRHLPLGLAVWAGIQQGLDWLNREYRERAPIILVYAGILGWYIWRQGWTNTSASVQLLILPVIILASYLGAILGGALAATTAFGLQQYRGGRLVAGAAAALGYFVPLAVAIRLFVPLPFVVFAVAAALVTIVIGPLVALLNDAIDGTA